MNRRTWKVFAILIAILLAGAAVSQPPHADAAILLKQGSANGDVWDLQFRLQLLGYYDAKMDGRYGYGTYNAVKRFQKNYGLRADGITGDGTWKALKRNSLNKAELNVMAKIIYSEARGESYKGQVAVGAVVMNRIQSNRFPNNIYDVVFQPGAFTAVDDGQYWLTPNRTAYLAAKDAVRGWDPTYGSLFYFNPGTATSKWIWSLPQNVKIGKHIFAG